MSYLAEQILQTVEALPTEDQQQVLDWARSILAKRQTEITEAKPQSFSEVAQTLIGAGEGPGDLSTNPEYLQGYGQ